MLFLGMWPLVMRQIICLWSETEYSSFGISIVAGRVVGALNICAVDGLLSYVIFSFTYGQEWESRVVSWLVNFLCCVVGQVAPVGLNCSLLPGVEGALRNHSGPHAVSIVPLKINDLNRCLVDVSVRVMGGTDIHSLMNHLQARLKEHIRDSILLSCPKLLQVTINYVLLSVV